MDTALTGTVVTTRLLPVEGELVAVGGPRRQPSEKPQQTVAKLHTPGVRSKPRVINRHIARGPPRIKAECFPAARGLAAKGCVIGRKRGARIRRGVEKASPCGRRAPPKVATRVVCVQLVEKGRHVCSRGCGFVVRGGLVFVCGRGGGGRGKSSLHEGSVYDAAEA